MTFSRRGQRRAQSEPGNRLFVAAADVHHRYGIAPDFVDHASQRFRERAGPCGIAELQLGKAGITRDHRWLPQSHS